LLNQLEIISGGSLEMDAEPLRRLSGGLVALLENVIMNGGGGEADFKRPSERDYPDAGVRLGLDRGGCAARERCRRTHVGNR